MRKNVRVITDELEKKHFISKFSINISLEDIDRLMDGCYARNSLLAMRKDWNLFSQFCRLKGVCPLPAATTAVRLFLEKESKQRKFSTIKRYTVTIGLVHKTLGLKDPTSNVAVRNILAALRIEKRSDSVSTTAFSKQHLIELTHRLLPSKSKRDVRNLAIYHLMFECMLKRSELRDLNFEALDFSNDRYSVWIGSNEYILTKECSNMLSRWIEARGTLTGPLFNAIDRFGNLGSLPLDDSSIYRILRDASDKLNLDVKFSGQSLRVGAANELASKGVKVKDIQHLGRWKSAAMPYQYVGNKAQAALERMIYKSFKPWD
ncbi:integrase [Vibrio galatheae]|uniref:Integrase n=1 Tax=Vibrio galatheae TaxID=579748 RepID=A0A0F4NP43_9VIBR|nr:tyrosine-type recombinase/integrase [Vibrio galatheae]KJY83871.1 integrase [Vibrio galatheae]